MQFFLYDFSFFYFIMPYGSAGVGVFSFVSEQSNRLRNMMSSLTYNFQKKVK